MRTPKRSTLILFFLSSLIILSLTLLVIEPTYNFISILKTKDTPFGIVALIYDIPENATIANKALTTLRNEGYTASLLCNNTLLLFDDDPLITKASINKTYNSYVIFNDLNYVNFIKKIDRPNGLAYNIIKNKNDILYYYSKPTFSCPKDTKILVRINISNIKLYITNNELDYYSILYNEISNVNDIFEKYNINSRLYKVIDLGLNTIISSYKNLNNELIQSVILYPLIFIIYFIFVYISDKTLLGEHSKKETLAELIAGSSYNDVIIKILKVSFSILLVVLTILFILIYNYNEYFVNYRLFLINIILLISIVIINVIILYKFTNPFEYIKIKLVYLVLGIPTLLYLIGGIYIVFYTNINIILYYSSLIFTSIIVISMFSVLLIIKKYYPEITGMQIVALSLALVIGFSSASLSVQSATDDLYIRVINELAPKINYKYAIQSSYAPWFNADGFVKSIKINNLMLISDNKDIYLSKLLSHSSSVVLVYVGEEFGRVLGVDDSISTAVIFLNFGRFIKFSNIDGLSDVYSDVVGVSGRDVLVRFEWYRHTVKYRATVFTGEGLPPYVYVSGNGADIVLLDAILSGFPYVAYRPYIIFYFKNFTVLDDSVFIRGNESIFIVYFDDCDDARALAESVPKLIESSSIRARLVNVSVGSEGTCFVYYNITDYNAIIFDKRSFSLFFYRDKPVNGSIKHLIDLESARAWLVDRLKASITLPEGYRYGIGLAVISGVIGAYLAGVAAAPSIRLMLISGLRLRRALGFVMPIIGLMVLASTVVSLLLLSFYSVILVLEPKSDLLLGSIAILGGLSGLVYALGVARGVGWGWRGRAKG